MMSLDFYREHIIRCYILYIIFHLLSYFIFDINGKFRWCSRTFIKSNRRRSKIAAHNRNAFQCICKPKVFQGSQIILRNMKIQLCVAFFRALSRVLGKKSLFLNVKSTYFQQCWECDVSIFIKNMLRDERDRDHFSSFRPSGAPNTSKMDLNDSSKKNNDYHVDIDDLAGWLLVRMNITWNDPKSEHGWMRPSEIQWR